MPGACIRAARLMSALARFAYAAAKSASREIARSKRTSALRNAAALAALWYTRIACRYSSYARALCGPPSSMLAASSSRSLTCSPPATASAMAVRAVDMSLRSKTNVWDQPGNPSAPSMSRTVMRTALPNLQTPPSSSAATFSVLATV